MSNALCVGYVYTICSDNRPGHAHSEGLSYINLEHNQMSENQFLYHTEI